MFPKTPHTWNSHHLECLHLVIQVEKNYLNDSYGLDGDILSLETTPDYIFKKKLLANRGPANFKIMAWI